MPHARSRLLVPALLLAVLAGGCRGGGEEATAASSATPSPAIGDPASPSRSESTPSATPESPSPAPSPSDATPSPSPASPSPSEASPSSSPTPTSPSSTDDAADPGADQPDGGDGGQESRDVEAGPGAGGSDGALLGELEVGGEPSAISSLCRRGDTVLVVYDFESSLSLEGWTSDDVTMTTVTGASSLRTDEVRTDFTADGLRSYAGVFDDGRTIAVTIPAEVGACDSRDTPRRADAFVTVERLDGTGLRREPAAACRRDPDRLRVVYGDQQLTVVLRPEPAIDLSNRGTEEATQPATRTGGQASASYAAGFSPDLTGGIVRVAVQLNGRPPYPAC